MKLTPLLLFLLILVVLVIAVTTLKKPLASVEKEGFVQFKTNVVPQTETVVPPYSGRSIVKLYDNLFIDRQNLNIVEVVSSEFVGNVDATFVVTNGNVDLTGSSITAIYVQTRDGAVKNTSVTSTDIKESDESKIDSITKSYKSVPFYNSACSTTAKYQLFYVPWGTDTFIHGIQVTATPSDPVKSLFKPLNLYSYYIPSDKTSNMSAVYYPNNIIDLIVPTSADTSAQNGKMVTEPLYSTTRQVYQLSSDIKYEIKTGNIIVNADKSIIVYNKVGVSTTYSSVPADSDIPSASSSGTINPAWVANNATNSTQIVYLNSTSGNKTVVMLLQKDVAGRFNVLNISRFNKKRVIGENGEGDHDDDEDGSKDDDSTHTTDPPSPGPDVNPSAISDYYKWYWYWNSAGPGTNAQYSNNYLLKTQIVPPVCPSCPTATCASTAGSVDGDKNGSVKKDKDGNIITDTVDTAGNVINKTVDTTSNVLNKTIDTTSNLLTSGATGATNILTSGVAGATNLLTSGVAGGVDLVKSGATGGVGLLRDAGSGVVKIADKTLKTTGNIVGNLANPNAVGGAGAYYGGLNTPYGSNSGYSSPGFSRGSPPVDNYSYYGALPNKGSNYIPITADFSAFKK